MIVKDSSGKEVEIREGKGEVEISPLGFDLVGKSIKATFSNGYYKTRDVYIPISQMSVEIDDLWGDKLYIPRWLARNKKIG